MASPALGQGDAVGALLGCRDQAGLCVGTSTVGAAEPGLPSPSAPGLRREQQLEKCLAHPGSIASLSHRLPAPTPFVPLFRKMLETTFPFIFSLWFILYLAAQRSFWGTRQSPQGLGKWTGCF